MELQVNASTLNNMWRGYNTRFQAAFANAPTFYQRISMTVPSTGRANTYAWLDKLPRMREWLGERVLQNVRTKDYTILNRDWESTVEIERNDINDNQMGIYGPITDMVAQAAAKLPDELMVELLRNGNSAASTTYDGVPFFSTLHPGGAGGATQANYGTGVALNEANYEAKRSQMGTLLGADGKPFGAGSQLLLVVPPQLEMPGRRIVGSPLLTGGATNVLAGTAEVLVIPELSVDATTWYLLDVSLPIKPFVFQPREDVNFVRKWSMTDDNVFWMKKYVMGADRRAGAGYGMWWMASKWVG